MITTTLRNISLKEYNLKNLPLVKRLREKMLATPAQVCIERASYLTKYLRETDDKHRSMQIRYAEAVSNFLSNKQTFFFDDNMLAGTTTSKPFGAPVYPELTGLTIWPELDTISTRPKNPIIISAQDAETLDFEIFPYWMERNVLEITRKEYNNPSCMKLFERLILFLAGKAGCVSHTVPYFQIVLENGIESLIKDAAEKESKIKKRHRLTLDNKKKADFYKSLQIALNGIMVYTRNLKNKALKLARLEKNVWRKKNLQIMASVCDRVPAKGARTFREAVNSLWLLLIAIHAENINMAISPGRLDQLLYRFYKHDIDNGILTLKEALELIGCLWIKLNDNTNVVPESAEELFGGSGTVPAVTVGGVNENDEDAVNDMTYIILRITELLQMRDPNLNARFNYKKNNPEYRDRVAEVIATTKAVPAIHNDVAAIETLINQGIHLQHARDFAIIGCVELTSGGRSYDASSSIILNLTAAMELTLHNGKLPACGSEQLGPHTNDFTSFAYFNQFLNAFELQFKWLAGQAIEINELLGSVHQQVLPSPILSAFFKGPLMKGKDLIHGGALYNSSGATHIGFADTVDSISAIEKAVFIDKKYSLAELNIAIMDDFTGHEEMQAYLIYRTPKFGTRDPLAQKNAQYLIKLINDFYQSHTNYRSGKYRPAYWTMTNHVGLSKYCGALPNGRKAYQPFASGITPVSQIHNDLSSCLKAVAALDSRFISGGEALNLKFPAISCRNDIRHLAETIEAYFRLGGLQVQFNISSYEILMDAKKHPEKYLGLLVRVSGYSAYFNDLSEAMKDEIITRTAYDFKSGKPIIFDKKHVLSS